MSRHRRTNAELEALDALIRGILEPDRPQSVRHVYYRLVDMGVDVPKTENGYELVGRRCTSMRRAGTLPYNWLVDSTRRGHHVTTYASPADLIYNAAYGYREDMWQESDVYCEVWTESRSIAGVIQSTCRDLGVSLYPAGGFASLSLTHEAAENIRERAAGRPVRLVYIGDYDPAGTIIDEAICKELREHLPGHDIAEERIAITAEQAARLPGKPRKDGERRKPEIEQTVEAEAMPATELRDLLAVAVKRYLAAGVLERAQESDERARVKLQKLARMVDALGVGGVLNAADDEYAKFQRETRRG